MGSVAALALLSAGCGNGFDPALSPLLDVTWELEAIEGADAGPAEGPEGVPSLVFGREPAAPAAGGRRLSGDTGCNLLGGGYTAAADGTLALDGLSWTERACLEPGIMELEQAFLDALLAAVSWRMEGSELTLRSPDATLRFRPGG